MNLFDYRYLAIGSLLPDIIDKPLAWLVLPDLIETTRSVGHTLAFAVLLLALAGVAFQKGRGFWMFSLAIGTCLHLIFDRMWTDAETLLWPAFGFGFPKSGGLGIRSYSYQLWNDPLAAPWNTPFEILGTLIIGVILFRLLRLRRVKYFLKTGLLLTSGSNDIGTRGSSGPVKDLG